MRKPSLTFDTLVAALAVLGVSASAGCSKADRASASPEPAVAPGASATASAAAPSEVTPPAPPAPQAAPSAPPARETKPSRAAITGTAVDGGAPAKKSGGSMSCGAGTCSDDMKKGN